MATIILPLDYEKRLQEYNDKVNALEEQRNEFYAKNPDYPFKNMFMNVMAPPQKCIVNFDSSSDAESFLNQLKIKI